MSEYIARINKTIVVDRSKCVGCELCVGACTCKLLEMGEKFPQPREDRVDAVEHLEDLVRYVAPSCSNCRVCIITCPKEAIDIIATLQEEKKAG